VGTGFAVILNYQNAAGESGIAPAQWPEGTQLARDSGRDTLVMFAHPHCPCTRASLGELNRLLARSRGKVAAQVWFFKPASESSDWTSTDLWRSAASMPGVQIFVDVDGLQALRFGAKTSGSVLLYDTQGRLLFSGGITGGRGHAGDNAGESTLISLLDGKGAGSRQTPVYGCSLLGECPIADTEARK
jgi:glyoxylase-like metal-dependent hydrolase (beta-lactamase superfamily II)